MRDADAAMYKAKEHGKARLEVFDDSLRARALERLELEASLATRSPPISSSCLPDRGLAP